MGRVRVIGPQASITRASAAVLEWNPWPRRMMSRTLVFRLAPSANQLRLTDIAIERLTAPPDEDVGLPVSPERAGLVDFFSFKARLRRRGFASQARPLNAWGARCEAIFESWEAARFVPPPFCREDPRGAWVEKCRAELRRCLAEHGGAE